MRSPLSALEVRDFRVFWAGFVVSNVSTAMQAFGIGWLVVQLAVRDGTPERAPLYLGIVAISRAIPALALGLFGGVVADRRDRRALLLLSQGSFATIAIALAALTLADRVGLAWVVALSALMAATSSLYVPTRQSIQPRLVGEHNLMSAIGLNGLALNVGALAGPLIGGALIGSIRVGGARRIPRRRSRAASASSRRWPRACATSATRRRSAG